MTEPTTCPTCGSPVRVEGDDREGTHYYVPVMSEEVERLREALRRIAESYPWEPYHEGELVWRIGVNTGQTPTNRRIARQALGEPQ